MLAPNSRPEVAALLLLGLLAAAANCARPGQPEEPDADEPTSSQASWEPVVEPHLFRHLRNKRTHACLERHSARSVRFAQCSAGAQGQLWHFRRQDGRFVSSESASTCLKSHLFTAPCSDRYTEYQFAGLLRQRRSGKLIRAPEKPAFQRDTNFFNSDWELVRLPSPDVKVGPTSRPAKSASSSTSSSTTSSTSSSTSSAGKASPFRAEPRWYRFRGAASAKYLALDTADQVTLGEADEPFSYWLWGPEGRLVSRLNPQLCLAWDGGKLTTGGCAERPAHEWSYLDGRLCRGGGAGCLGTRSTGGKLEEAPVLVAANSSEPPPADTRWLLEEPANLDPGEGPLVIRHLDSNLCVGHSRRTFALAACNATNVDLLWRFHAASGQLRLGDRCLTRNERSAAPRLASCSNATCWDYDGWQLHHRSLGNFCLDNLWNRQKVGSAVVMHPCQPLDSLGQRLYLDEPPLSPAPYQEAGRGYQLIADPESATCLAVSESRHLSTLDCSSTDDPQSIGWLYDAHTGHIRSRRASDWCLARPEVPPGPPTFAECGSERTGWFYDGHSISGLHLNATDGTDAADAAEPSPDTWHLEPVGNKDVGVAPVQVRVARLCANVAANQWVLMGHCGEAASSWWRYEPHAGFLRWRLDADRCLARPVDSGRLKLADCDHKARWDYDGAQLRLRSLIDECADAKFEQSRPGDPFVSLACSEVANRVTLAAAPSSEAD